MGETNSPHGEKGIYVLPFADTSAIKRKQLDLAYGSVSAYQKLDLYLPDQGHAPFPLVVYIHGGAWMMCDKADIQVQPVLRALERGWAVAAVNYRLSGEALFPAQLADVKSALRWLRGNAAALGLDGNRMALWGSSAGAHLANLAALTAGATFFDAAGDNGEDSGWSVRAVVSWFGPTNFLLMDEYLGASGLGCQVHGQADSPESLLLGSTIADVPELVAQANPENWASPAAPPFFIQHGLADSIVPWQQSRDLAARLRSATGTDRVVLELLPGAEHADPAFETPENVDKALDFIGRWL